MIKLFISNRPARLIWSILLALVLLAAPLSYTVSAEDSGGGSEGGGGGGGGGTPPYHGTLRFITPVSPKTLGYAPDMGAVDYSAVTPVVEKLLDNAKDRSVNDGLEPVLASSYETDPINNYFTFHIRSGIKFSDGSVLNAEAVIWNFQVLIDSGVLLYLDHWSGISQIDNLTVRISFTQYDSRLIQAWGTTAIFSQAAYTANSQGDLTTYRNWAKTHVVGCGPFVLQTFVPEVQMTLIRNPNYWRSGRPYLDGITTFYISDPITAQMVLQSGQADEWLGAPLQDQVALVQQGYKRSNGWAGTPVSLWPNTVDPDSPFSNLKVRLALDSAIDKTALAQAIGSGFYFPMTMIAPPGEWGFDSSYPIRSFNTAKAKQLLADAGYPNGFSAKLLVNYDDASVQLATAIQGYLAAVGIRIDLDVADPGRFLSTVFGPNPQDDMVLFSTSLDTNFLATYRHWFSSDPLMNMSYLAHTPEQVAIDQAAKAAFSLADQQMAAINAVRYITDNALVIPLYNAPLALIDKSYVHNDRFSQGETRWQSENAWMGTGGAPLALSPASVGPVGAGETFNMDIRTTVDGAQPVDGVEAYVNFDPSMLEVIDADPAQSGVQIIPGVALPSVLVNRVDNSSGQISYSAGQLNQPFPTGAFTVATIQFRVKPVSTGATTPVTISLSGTERASIVDYGGNPLIGFHADAAVQIIPGASLSLNFTLQGSGRPESGWAVPVTVKFFTSGAVPVDVLTAVPAYTFILTSTKNGSFANCMMMGISPGNYDISLVTPHSLINQVSGVTISAPNTTVDMGTLLEGNANDDIKINIQDFGLLATSYSKSSGQNGYSARADFDCSGSVNISDFGLLSANYGKKSPQIQPLRIIPSGTLRVASLDFSYESTDPIYYESFWGWAMYDPLITQDAKGNPVGKVADSWSISPDGNTWTFNIHRGIKFWNGDPLTAADVKFSVDRFGGPESTNPWSHYLNESYNKVSSSVIDDYTFQYVTAHPEPTLVIPFAMTRILPMNYFNRVGQDGFRAAPMGSGPWKFVSHIPKTSFTMEANTEYWIPSLVPGFGTLINLLVPEEATQVNMLKNGEVDMIDVSQDNIVQLQKAGYRTAQFGESTQVNLSFQGTWLNSAGAAGDIRVRQALSYAVNRQQLCDGYFNGNAVPGGYFYMLPGDYGWDDAWQADSYDPPKAKQLLADANYPAGFTNSTIHIYVTPGPNVDLLTLLQGYWKAVGLDVKLELVDSAKFGNYFFNPSQRIQETDKNAGWAFPWVFESFFNSAYHAANMYTLQGAHNTCNDPKADQMYHDAVSELNPVMALQKWTAFQAYVHTLYINIGFCYVKSLYAIGSNVGALNGPNWISPQDAWCGFQPASR